VKEKNVLLLTAPGCRRSERVRQAFESAGVPFRELPLSSNEGTKMAVAHHVLSSPGIIVCGRALNVFDLFPDCRFDPKSLKERIREVASC